MSKLDVDADFAERADAALAASPEEYFVPLAALMSAVRFWWVVGLLTIAGGLMGWLAHRANPPVYEAVAHVSASIDYVSTGPLTQYEEDTAFDVVGKILGSNTLLKIVVERAGAEGIQLSLADLKKAIVLERRVNVWDLRVRYADAKTAERLANVWVEQGEVMLRSSYRHSLQAQGWDRYLLSLEDCLARAAASEPASAQCSSKKMTEIQSYLESVGKKYYEDRTGSRGWFPGLYLGPVEPAVGAAGPVLFNRNQLVLAGCFIGFVLGIALVQLGVPARLLSGRHKTGRS